MKYKIGDRVRITALVANCPLQEGNGRIINGRSGHSLRQIDLLGTVTVVRYVRLGLPYYGLEKDNCQHPYIVRYDFPIPVTPDWDQEVGCFAEGELEYAKKTYPVNNLDGVG